MVPKGLDQRDIDHMERLDASKALQLIEDNLLNGKQFPWRNETQDILSDIKETSIDLDKLEAGLTWLERRGIDITSDESTWSNTIRLAIADTFGEAGREYFHRLSRIYSNYDPKETDQKYDWAVEHSRGVHTLGSIFHLLHKEGWRYFDADLPQDNEGWEEFLSQSSDIVHMRSQEDIKEQPALIVHEEVPILFRNSITVIQGQRGQHKTRLMETVTTILLGKEDMPIGKMRRDNADDVYILWFDTERDKRYQLPMAIQKVTEAALGSRDRPDNFRVYPMTETPRHLRQDLIRSKINYHRTLDPTRHYLIVIDVVTDIVSDFNSSHDTLLLVDYVNMLINKYDVSILVVLHENPFSNKGRGHAGTEFGNKATVQISVNFMQGSDEIISAQFQKHRHAPPNYMMEFVYDKSNALLKSPDQEDRGRYLIPDDNLRTLLVGFFINEEGEFVGRRFSELYSMVAKDFPTGKNAFRDMLSSLIKHDVKLFHTAYNGYFKMQIRVKEHNAYEYYLKMTQL